MLLSRDPQPVVQLSHALSHFDARSRRSKHSRPPKTVRLFARHSNERLDKCAPVLPRGLNRFSSPGIRLSCRRCEFDSLKPELEIHILEHAVQDIIEDIEPILKRIATELGATFDESKSVLGKDAAEFFLKLTNGARIQFCLDGRDWMQNNPAPKLEIEIRRRLQAEAD